MTDSFAAGRMAEGYAKARPPVHPRIVQRIGAHLGRRVDCALDLGCGAGLSTRPLAEIAARCAGIDPMPAMIAAARHTAPRAAFAVAPAEALPFADGCFDLITAAGSLNYADPKRAFPEAARVLQPSGVLVVYDFSPGRAFRSDESLSHWFRDFECRYPWPQGDALELNPEILGRITRHFRLSAHENFEIALPIAPEFYLEYVMTETNVSRSPEPPQAIRAWCRETLGPVFGGQTREVLFRGYIAYLTRAG